MSVQEQSFYAQLPGQLIGGISGIFDITKDGKTRVLTVHPNLMGAAGDGLGFTSVAPARRCTTLNWVSALRPAADTLTLRSPEASENFSNGRRPALNVQASALRPDRDIACPCHRFSASHAGFLVSQPAATRITPEVSLSSLCTNSR